MSFQGDVGGIGLAELLQSLSRGRREGVLRLHTGSGLSANVGLEDGIVHFLPATDEDPVIWKERARQAWINDQDYRIDAVRMSQIARAHRIENLYRILDSEGVHFRFEPGGLPKRTQSQKTDGESADTARMPEVHCEGMPVEYLLLEYARMSDEASGLPELQDISDYVVPRTQSAGEPGQAAATFLKECDGQSTLSEVADRLGWTLRQARLAYLEHERQGHLRPARHHELIVLAQRELAQGHILRASARLVGWIQSSPPGPMESGDASLIMAEFKADRMSALLNRMPTSEARTLLKRLEHAIASPESSVKHWRELQRLKRRCPIIDMHRVGVEFRWEDEEELPSLRELLDQARKLRDEGHPRRAGAFLRMAASRDPQQAHARMDIGLGMLAAGLIEEGAAWILDAAQLLIASGAAEKAIGPLRTLLEVAPEIREARRILGRLRHLTVRRPLIRKNSLIGLSIVTAVSIGALVSVQVRRDTEVKLAEIAALIDTPERAESLLAEYFPEAESERVEELRHLITEQRRIDEADARNVWYEAYREAQTSCTLGDPFEGLRLALELQTPPKLQTVTEPWPLVSDLFSGLAARLESELEALGEVELVAPEQVEGETQLEATTSTLLESLAERELDQKTEDLVGRLEELNEAVHDRIRERAERLREKQSQDLLTSQDLLLARARARAESGDLELALEEYALLLESDATGRIRRIFDEEISDVRRRWDAIVEARTLAGDGQHLAARAVLEADLEDPDAQPLPWKLESFPSGALVELPDGSLRATPFVFESRFGEELAFRISLEGHETTELLLGAPADQFLWLSKLPERRWSSSGRVEALPVPVEDDHIVCDRGGRLARLRVDGEPAWERELLSLGGVARPPVFLPQRPGELLLLTEDGEAWFLDAASGELEGPASLGESPLEGPVATSDSVVARTKSGALATWTTRLKPKLSEGGELPADAALGSSAGLSVLRQGERDARHHDSPWSEWSVEIRPEVFRVRPTSNPQAGFAILRSGEWSFLAWEAPREGLPSGRLWVSDAAGIAAYQP